MKLETKYGVLEGTVEEFRELLEGKRDLSYFSGKVDRYTEPTYKVVNKDTIDYLSGKDISKGTVLEHTSRDWYTTKNIYTDTLGKLYELHANDIDDCNDVSMRDLFKSSKERGTLLKQGVNNPTYKIVNEDNVVCFLDLNKKLPKGLVLKHIKEDAYEDTLGVRYLLYDRYLDDYNGSWVDGKFKSFKDKKILLIQKEEYKVVKENIHSSIDGSILLEKGTILLETKHNYKNSLGNTYLLSPDTLENKLKEFYIVGIRFHFEEHKRNKELYKVELP
ncbi:hypothetical protein [Mammaliicoccus virus vB_MscM-PMS2]|nr:hypothetical protein [Mammaliicoccus virus vB_MscM-PMS2]